MKLEFWMLFFGYYIFEKAYFGWNMMPRSPEEVIASGIGVLIVAIGFAKGN